MAVNRNMKKQYRRWLQLLMAGLVVVAILLIVKVQHFGSPNKSKTEHTGLVTMLGIKNKSPEKLESYESVSGVLNIQHWTTDHGVNVYFVHVPTLPMVDIDIHFDAGAARNGNKGGMAYLTNTLLSEGTAELSADMVATNFDKVGAQFHASSLRDASTIHLRSLSDQQLLVPAVQNLAKILSAPAFPENGFKREQQNALTTLKQQSQMPNQVASRAFFFALYGNQPYANWVLGDEASIKALTVADVKAFHKQYYVAKNATVTIVGDVTASDADVIAQTLTNALPQGEKPAPIPTVANLDKKSLKKINFPSSQTHILMGEPGIIQGDPDYYALYVGNHILGGNGSVTRIFNTIRNQHGLAYSAYSYFLPMRERGPFVLGCQTRNDQAEKALSLMQELLKEFVDKGPTEKELDQAKQNLLGGYTLQFDSNSAICQQVASLGFYGLPLDHFNEFKVAVQKLTIDDIKNAYKKRILPDSVAVVMVGGEASKIPSPPIEPKKSSSHHDTPQGGGVPGGTQG